MDASRVENLEMNEKLPKTAPISPDLGPKTMEEATAQLTALLTSGPPDIRRLERDVLQLHAEGRINGMWIMMLQANIEIAKTKGWVVKVKIFTHLLDRLERAIKADIAEKAGVEGLEKENLAASNLTPDANRSALSKNRQTHAPRAVPVTPVFGGPTERVVDKLDAEKHIIEFRCALTKFSNPVIAKGKKGKKSGKKVIKKTFEGLADKTSAVLGKNGWCVCDGLIAASHTRGILKETFMLEPKFEESEIWVGKEANVGAMISVPSVRGDSVLWMCGGHNDHAPDLFDSAGVQPKTKNAIEPCDPVIKAQTPLKTYLSLQNMIRAMDAFVMEHLAKKIGKLKLVRSRSDAMLAKYPGNGSRFQRHIDNTAKDGRVLTVVCYFNENWEESNGGAVRIHPRDTPEERDQASHDVAPLAGRCVMFYSDEFPHEVMPTHKDRYAMTLWYYDQEERSTAVQEARATEEANLKQALQDASDGNLPKAPSNPSQVQAITEKEQKQAKNFIHFLMDGGGKPITDHTLQDLSNRVDSLSPASASIVASVVGAPDHAGFVESVKNMTQENLLKIRADFSRMGMS